MGLVAEQPRGGREAIQLSPQDRPPRLRVGGRTGGRRPTHGRAALASRLESCLRSAVAEGAIVKQRQEAELQRRIASEAARQAQAAAAGDEERIRERVRAFSALMNQARYEEAYKEALVLNQEQ